MYVWLCGNSANAKHIKIKKFNELHNFSVCDYRSILSTNLIPNHSHFLTL